MSSCLYRWSWHPWVTVQGSLFALGGIGLVSSDLKYRTQARKSERMMTKERPFHFVYRTVILLAVHGGCPAANSYRRSTRALTGSSLSQVRSFIPLPYLVTLAVSHGIRASAHGLQEGLFRMYGQSLCTGVCELLLGKIGLILCRSRRMQTY